MRYTVAYELITAYKEILVHGIDWTAHRAADWARSGHGACQHFLPCCSSLKTPLRRFLKITGGLQSQQNFPMPGTRDDGGQLGYGEPRTTLAPWLPSLQAAGSTVALATL